MVDPELAKLSDQLMLGTVLAYVAAMLGYAADLAFGHRRAAAAAERKVLVGAAGSAEAETKAEIEAEVETGTEPGTGRGEVDWGRFAVLFTVLGWGLHTGSLVTRGLAVQRWPWANMYEFLAAIALAAVTAYLVVLWREKARFLGAFVMVLAIVALGVDVIWFYTDAGPVDPALKSYWIAIHVTAAIVSTGGFAVAGVATLLYLPVAKREARDAVTGLWSRLPSGEALDRLANRVTMFVFPIWTFAIIAGAIWADEAWGRYWGWDPKEIWSFVTWVLYAAYLHARATAGWNRRAQIISLLAFAALLFNFFGVNYLFSGLHSYAGG
ncbi:c-type cytochrome biogenesis protein CcsB [Actinomadura craniellae]|uniref:C-type cytochrome biogenesis protein CcsB n=1 Tax=Actinomadura craniellae TaxID=2231787 RepID=A0A365H893_9ACTN|nr:c-type cytochrome biogenesis protein CcsB [Actinomadura craniellae]RAY15291.1 c-type cytochrome biogenesis protein CcsB [Actinomadura craniellae]